MRGTNEDRANRLAFHMDLDTWIDQAYKNGEAQFAWFLQIGSLSSSRLEPSMHSHTMYALTLPKAFRREC